MLKSKFMKKNYNKKRIRGIRLLKMITNFGMDVWKSGDKMTKFLSTEKSSLNIIFSTVESGQNNDFRTASLKM